MPVFENNKLTGIISMSDVVKETILAQKETINQLQNYIHENTTYTLIKYAAKPRKRFRFFYFFFCFLLLYDNQILYVYLH